jgi:hypothetical protein
MKNLIWVMAAMAALIIAYVIGYGMGMQNVRDGTGGEVIVRCDTVTVTDTVVIREPVAVGSEVIDVVKRLMKVSDGAGGAGAPAEWKRPNLAADETGVKAAGTGAAEIGEASQGAGERAEGVKMTPEERAKQWLERQEVKRNGERYEPPDEDSVWVEIPITQTVYEDENFKAWVSGYEAKLDSIVMYDQTMRIENYVKEKRRWGCVIGAGIGAGRHGVEPMVGVTVGWRLW